jgi:hypothetical protein
MSSGSFEIATFSWERCIPLSTNTTAYSSLTTFATGADGFLQPFSFYQFTTASGFPDTSTFSTAITKYVGDSLASTVKFLGKTYVSTIPTANFSSNYFQQSPNYPGKIVLPNVSFGPAFINMINSKQYNVFVESQYNLWLDANDSFTFVSTVGVFNTRVNNLYGRTTTTRVGNSNYTQINTKFMFTPQKFGEQYQIPAFSSTFHLEIFLQSTPNVTYNTSPAFSVFVPGENNYTFTLVPVTSTILN